jgi:hypothetical protein
MPIPGTITILQPLDPNTESDPTPITNPRYGLGGLRSVGTTANRDDIPQERREEGMMVYVQDTDIYYALVGGTGNGNWIEFTPSGLGPEGPTGQQGATGPQIIIIDSFATSIPALVKKGSSNTSLSGNTMTLSYAGQQIPATGSVFLTDPSKGTGFPVFFNNGNLTSILFSNQSITAGVGEEVTLRIVVTGQDGTRDQIDHTVRIENELRWGKSNQTSIIQSADLVSGLTNSALISEPTYEFSVSVNEAEYIFFCYPSRLGQSTQSINNAAYGGMGLQGSRRIQGQSPILLTNDLAFSEPFYVYRSENASLGSNLKVTITPIIG